MYHIFYLFEENRYTGVNIPADNIQEALQRFAQEYGDKDIYYICKKDT